MNHANQYTVGVALCTLGNIASVEMARDLFPEVETIIASANPYIRRKAALCAMRICRKVPDLQEHFLDKAKLLLQDRNHGVLLCGITLVASLCEADEAEEEDSAVFDKTAMAEDDTADLYEKAVKVVLRDKKCSTSYIQRRLSIGYNRAASLVERMEPRVVGWSALTLDIDLAHGADDAVLAGDPVAVHHRVVRRRAAAHRRLPGRRGDA